MADLGVQIPIGFTLDEAQAALRALEAEARRTGKQIQTGIEQGAKGIDSAGKGMMQFAREQRREAATARFFISEFAAFLPVGSKFRDVALAMTEALVGGMGVGVAITAVTLSVKWLTQYLNEQAEAEKKAQESADDHAKFLRDLKTDTDAYIRSLGEAPASLEVMYKAQHDFDEKTLKDKRRLAEIEQTLSDLAAKKAAFQENTRAGAAILDIDRQQTALFHEQEAALRRIAAAEGDLEATRQQAARRIRGEEGKATGDAAQKAREALRDERQKEQQAAFADAKKWHDLELAELLRATDAEYDIRDRAAAANVAARMSEAEEILALTARMEEERKAIVRDAETQIKQYGIDAFRSLASAIAAELGKAMTVSRAYARAMKAATGETVEGADLSAAAIEAMVQNILAALSQQAMVESLMMLARGFAYSSLGLADKATAAFTASAYFAATAALAGAVAMTIGATRGMTASERSQVDAARDAQRSDLTGGTSGAREVGGESGGRNTATRETIIVIGDPFETPAETARRAARRVSEARRLDMLARSDA